MRDDIFKTNENDLSYGRGYVYSLRYHIVWCTKYRAKVLSGQIEMDLKEYLAQIAGTIGIIIETMEVMPDHVHLLISAKPQFCPAYGMKILKGNVSHWLFQRHPEIKRRLWGGHLWNPSYCVLTVSDRTKEQIERYIRGQKTAPVKYGKE